MNLNPAWKLASVIVAVCLAWTQIEPAAFAQAPAEKAARQEEVTPPDTRVAMAAPAPAPTPAAAAPAKAPQAGKKSKWWVLLGIAAAGVVSAVVISRHQSDQPSITGLPPCVGAGC